MVYKSAFYYYMKGITFSRQFRSKKEYRYAVSRVPKRYRKDFKSGYLNGI